MVFDEKCTEQFDEVGLAKIVRNLFTHDIDLQNEVVAKLQMTSAYRVGGNYPHRKHPIPVCVQFNSKSDKKIIRAGSKC